MSIHENPQLKKLWEEFTSEYADSVGPHMYHYLPFWWLFDKLIAQSSNTDEYLVTEKSRDRLVAEYEKYGSLTIGFDFDGTVHDYHKTGATYEQVRQLIRDLKDIGCTLICWTAYQDLSFVAKFLEENNIPFDGINTNGIKLPWESKKPFFSALLDDRAGLIQVYNDLRYLVDYIKNK
jgi:hypothetical protein